MDRQLTTIKINKSDHAVDVSNNLDPWLIFVVDDVQSVLDVTCNVLKHLQYDGRSVQLECAHSAQEAKQLYQRFPEPAVILVDCVMEKKDAGIELVEFIRHNQKNQLTQIVLRTGQPGVAPEHKVLEDHQINDYLMKTEISSTKLKNKVISYLGNYQMISSVATENKQLQERSTTETVHALAGSIIHEIKSPLSQINLNLKKIRRILPQLTKSKLDSNIVDTLYDYTDTSQNAVKRSQQIIGLMLEELKNEEVNTSGFNYFSARQLIEQSIDDYAYLDEDEMGRISIEEGDDFLVYIDEIRFNLILFNLFSNTLYYLPVCKNLIVNVALERGNDFHMIIIRDNGPGIAQEKQVHLFDDFYTYDKQGGTGLGLSFCKRMMTAFEGTIQCNSNEGEFTEFILSFPATKAPEKEALAWDKIIVDPSIVDNVLAKRTLLVVDDEKINRLAIADLLRDTGISIIAAENVEVAYSLLEEFYCDFIITDLHIPIVGGLDFIKTIRSGNPFSQYDCFATVPITVVSGDRRDEIVNACYQAGANQFLEKPLEQDKLANILAKQLISNMQFLPTEKY